MKTHMKIILSVALVLMVQMTLFGQQISINGRLNRNANRKLDLINVFLRILVLANLLFVI